MERKEYKKPYIILNSQEFEDIICVSFVDDDQNIFDFDEEL